jgi:hypothetical protein
VSYQIIPGRDRALCCMCGTGRTFSIRRRPRRYAAEGYSPGQLQQARDHGAPLPDHWKPWHRMLGDLKCATCGETTRHALLRDNCPMPEWRNHAEDEDHARSSAAR